VSNQELVIEPPIRGHWAIYNPPGHPPLAYDFLAVDESKSLYYKGGFLRHLVSFIPVEDTRTWSRPVFSPVDGVVVVSRDSESDRKKLSFLYDMLSLLIKKPKVSDGFGAFGGNHIMIRAGDNFVLLCHLRQGSSRVQKGDVVKVGQWVGEIGNSGLSIQPHLHLQVMSDEQYFPLFANLLSFKFSKGKVKHGSGWTIQQNFELQNKGHYLFDSENA
jgi:murein DD-endopeptidase MepM/ murein hydrolase activator NlpD